MEKIYKKEKTIIMTGIFIFFFLNISRASYFKKINIKGKSQIAKPIIETELGEKIKIREENSNGVYNLKVKNYNEQNEITDKEIAYQIQLLEYPDDIEVKIYDKNGECKLNNNKTATYKFSNKQKEENKYEIRVEVKKAKVINFKVKIKVNAFQEEEKNEKDINK